MKTEEKRGIDYLEALIENGKNKPLGAKPSIQEAAVSMGVNRSTVYRMVERYVQAGILDKEYRLTEYGMDWLAKRKIQQARLEGWMERCQVKKENVRANTTVMLDNCTPDLLAYISNTGLMCRGCEYHPIANVHNWFSVGGKDFKDKLGRGIPDGSYPIPFTFFKDNKQELLELSMASRGFEHPAILELKDGEGCVLLKVRAMSQQSASGKWYTGEAVTVKYRKVNEWVEAESRAHTVRLPMSAFWLAYDGKDFTCLRGMASIKMACSAGPDAMGESEALMQIRILKA